MQHSPEPQELAEIQPDALLILSRETELAPVAGERAALVRETGRLARYGRITMLTIPGVALFEAVLRYAVAPDEQSAETTFANEREGLRRDGWTMREPDPWETPDPLRSDAPTPF